MRMTVYDNVKKALQDIIAPELKAMNSRLDVIQVEIRRLDEKIDSVNTQLNEKIDAVNKQLNEKIDAVNTHLNERINMLNDKLESVREEVRNTRMDYRNAIDIHERLAALEVKIGRC